MKFNTGRVINLSSLYASFQTMHDKRKMKGKRYALEIVMPCIFLVKLYGEVKCH